MSAEAAADAPPEGAPAALHLISEATGRQVDAFGIAEGDALFLAPSALSALGLTAFAADTREWLSLADAPGVKYTYDADSGDVRITCAAQCFSTQRIGAVETAPPVAVSDAGAFLNVDTVLTELDGETDAAGAFELGVFGARGFGEATWTAGAGQGADITRLETRWTTDDPRRRVRYRIGDSVARGGAATDAFRFAGVQVARDFTLEPGFVTTPTPSLSGVATMPSVVDLYVDGALRLRERVDAGPFTITDAPVVNGAGDARVVVTDVLGREQVTFQRFYAGREMLRPGLSDFSVALGALRENFGSESADYGRGVASGVYRRGLSDDVTADVRAEASGDRAAVSLGASWTPGTVGQFDATIAESMGDDQNGGLVRVGWMRSSAVMFYSADIETTEPGFARIGGGGNAIRTRVALSAGASSRRFGALSASATLADRRIDADLFTAAIDYAPAWDRFGTLGFNLLYTDDGDSVLTAGVSLVTPLGDTRAVSQSVTAQDGRLSAQVRAQQTPLPEGGLGWRLSARGGDSHRAEAGATLRGRFGEADVEASRAWSQTGLRAQLGFGLVWIDGGLHVSRQVQDSFALVDVGAPNVRVLRENTPIGTTGADGRLLVTALRPYERNHLGIETNDLPAGAPVTVDSMIAVPGPRGGVVVRFPVETGAAGEAHVVDEDGSPLPLGVVLTAEDERYPVGRDGRVFVSGVQDRKALRRAGADACEAVVNREALDSATPIICRRLS